MSGRLTGVRTRATDVNPCHSHKLNHTCRTVSQASYFLSVYVFISSSSYFLSVYVFISSSIPHTIFMSQQKELGFTRQIQVKKLSDTRWSCQFSSINAIMTTILPLLRTLEEILENSTDR